MTSGKERLGSLGSAPGSGDCPCKRILFRAGLRSRQPPGAGHGACRAPAALLRQELSKPDLLAEAIIALNDEQITWLESRPEATDESLPLQEAVERYLRRVYEFDIKHITLRRMGAAFGWLWAPKYEPRIWKQLFALHGPHRRYPASGRLQRSGTHHQDTLVTLLRGLSPCGHAPGARGVVPCRDSTGPKADPPALTP